MKTKLGLLLLMMLIAVGCDDSTHSGEPDEQAAEPTAEHPTKPVPADLPIIELPSITNTLDRKFNKIPAGTFMMGSPETEEGHNDNENQHKVTINKAFYIQTTEVTQGQWKAVMGTEPWKGKQWAKEGANYPAVYVSWNDAVAYCKKLSEKEGKTYRLPTEAEWEYACRAGTQTAWSFGDDAKALGDHAWHRENAVNAGELYAHQVGLKKPNAFGLYDMHGNVWELCHDYYGKGYYKPSPATDPQGPTGGSWHLFRGGSWQYLTRGTRSAERGAHGEGLINPEVFGFRVVRELD
jgi:formylglycine-generating enzyme required for sulfatase activity